MGQTGRFRLPTVAGLMAVAAVTLAAASAVHFGVVLPPRLSDPFRGAAIPEAVVAAVLAGGLATVLSCRAVAWPVALGTTLFALLAVVYGLTVTVGGGRTGDVAYHLSLLAVLLAAAALLLAPGGRRALSAAK
jgi:hypothetical protein